MSIFEELSDKERRVYETIKKCGKNGICQKDLWKQLGMNSREASRIVIKLEKLGLITRKPVVRDGRKTYLLIAVPSRKRVTKPKKEKLPPPRINISEFLDIPCVKCPFISKCYVGGFYNPQTCIWLERWIEENIKKKRQ